MTGTGGRLCGRCGRCARAAGCWFTRTHCWTTTITSTLRQAQKSSLRFANLLFYAPGRACGDHVESLAELQQGKRKSSSRSPARRANKDSGASRAAVEHSGGVVRTGHRQPPARHPPPAVRSPVGISRAIHLNPNGIMAAHKILPSGTIGANTVPK